jgi:hypothetical protein
LATAREAATPPIIAAIIASARCRLSALTLSGGAVMPFAQAPLARSQPAFAITVVTPAGDQFWTNSVIIEGTHEVMLVDAQLTKTNAQKVLQAVKATNKPLSVKALGGAWRITTLGQSDARRLDNFNIINGF